MRAELLLNYHSIIFIVSLTAAPPPPLLVYKPRPDEHLPPVRGAALRIQLVPALQRREAARGASPGVRHAERRGLRVLGVGAMGGINSLFL